MIQAAGRVADATGNWVDQTAPQWARPYLRLTRLDRPIGWWLEAESLHARLRRETAGWATVHRAPFEPHGADVREL